MKKEVKKIELFCDFCGKISFEQCLNCGIDICWECQKTKAKEYRHAVSFSGSGGGVYCNDCDAVLRKTANPLHSAYLVVEALRNESSGWYLAFEKKSKEAESRLKELVEERKKRS